MENRAKRATDGRAVQREEEGSTARFYVQYTQIEGLKKLGRLYEEIIEAYTLRRVVGVDGFDARGGGQRAHERGRYLKP